MENKRSTVQLGLQARNVKNCNAYTLSKMDLLKSLNKTL